MDKKNYYLDLCFNSIYSTYEKCYLFGRIYESLHVPEVAPCSANFRDALFHFKKLYESDFNDEYVAQYESAIEHSNRLFKDSIVKLTHVLIFSLSKLMEITNEKEIYMKLYDNKVELKKIQINLRIKALEIIRPLEDDANKPVEVINSVIRSVKEMGLLEKLLDLNSKYNS